ARDVRAAHVRLLTRWWSPHRAAHPGEELLLGLHAFPVRTPGRGDRPGGGGAEGRGAGAGARPRHRSARRVRTHLLGCPTAAHNLIRPWYVVGSRILRWLRG